MPERQVSFTRMDQGTKADYELIAGAAEAQAGCVADHVLALLGGLEGVTLGYRVDRLEHSLQTATRAFRDGAGEETVCVALLHDIGDRLAPRNHSAFAAEILKPYVSAENHWLVRHHGIFQGYYYFHHSGRDRDARERYRDHPAFAMTADFCERWDQCSFDPDYDSMPLPAFEPMVRRLFARQAGALDQVMYS